MRALRRASAFTAVEMLVTVGALVIVLGMMVSVARYVRASSAEDVTKDLLGRLDQAMAQYIARNGGVPPAIPSLIPDEPAGASTSVDETAVARRAQLNNLAVVQLLRSNHVFPIDRFDDLSISYYNGLMVRDAWGSPIVFMPKQHPAVGMAAKGWFFFSAGPDRKYTTRSDNLYSYELPGLDRSSP